MKSALDFEQAKIIEISTENQRKKQDKKCHQGRKYNKKIENVIKVENAKSR